MYHITENQTEVKTAPIKGEMLRTEHVQKGSQPLQEEANKLGANIYIATPISSSDFLIKEGYSLEVMTKDTKGLAGRTIYVEFEGKKAVSYSVKTPDGQTIMRCPLPNGINTSVVPDQNKAKLGLSDKEYAELQHTILAITAKANHTFQMDNLSAYFYDLFNEKLKDGDLQEGGLIIQPFQSHMHWDLQVAYRKDNIIHVGSIYSSGAGLCCGHQTLENIRRSYQDTDLSKITDEVSFRNFVQKQDRNARNNPLTPDVAYQKGKDLIVTQRVPVTTVSSNGKFGSTVEHKQFSKVSMPINPTSKPKVDEKVSTIPNITFHQSKKEPEAKTTAKVSSNKSKPDINFLPHLHDQINYLSKQLTDSFAHVPPHLTQKVWRNFFEQSKVLWKFAKNNQHTAEGQQQAQEHLAQLQILVNSEVAMLRTYAKAPTLTIVNSTTVSEQSKKQISSTVPTVSSQPKQDTYQMAQIESLVDNLYTLAEQHKEIIAKTNLSGQVEKLFDSLVHNIENGSMSVKEVKQACENIKRYVMDAVVQHENETAKFTPSPFTSKLKMG